MVVAGHSMPAPTQTHDATEEDTEEVEIEIEPEPITADGRHRAPVSGPKEPPTPPPFVDPGCLRGRRSPWQGTRPPQP